MSDSERTARPQDAGLHVLVAAKLASGLSVFDLCKEFGLSQDELTQLSATFGHTLETNSLTELSDDVLMVCVLQKANRADRAFEELMKRYYEKIVIFLTRLVSNESTAKDLAQGTFEALWRTKRFQAIGAFQAFLYRIAKRKGSLHWKKQKKQRSMSSDCIIDALHRQNAKLDLDLGNPLHKRQLLRACISSLDYGFRALAEDLSEKHKNLTVGFQGEENETHFDEALLHRDQWRRALLNGK